MSSQNQSNVDFRLHPLFRDMPSQPSFCPAIWGDEDAPPLDWLVEGCFIRGTVALLSSDGGLGKSLLMQQLCTAAATGQNWLGLATKRLRSWAMFCEDDEAELHRRQVRINAHYGCRMGDLEDVTYRTRAGHASTFVDFAKWDARPMMTELFSSSLGAAKKFGAQLIILDTASDIFGGNEIARDQVRAFITLLRRWAILADGCVILTAHVSNEGLSSGSGLSGSRAWSNSVRSRLWLTEDKKDEGGTQRFLKTMKQNYGARGGKIPLRWRNGVFEKIELVAKNWSEPGLEWPER